MIERAPNNETYGPLISSEKLEVSLLPEVVQVTDTIIMTHMHPRHAESLYGLVVSNSDIPTQTGWASKVSALSDVMPAMQKPNNEVMDGRYVIMSGERLVGAIWTSAGPADHEFSIGYCLDESVRGQGIATCAVVALTEQLQKKYF